MLSCCRFGVVRSQFVLLLCPLGVFVVFLPSSFVLCCPPHVLLSYFCRPAAVVLFTSTLLSEAGAGAGAAHHHNNNSCRLSWLGSMLVHLLLVSTDTDAGGFGQEIIVCCLLKLSCVPNGNEELQVTVGARTRK